MSEITEGERGYPRSAHAHTGEQISTPVDTSGYPSTQAHNAPRGEKEQQVDEKPTMQKKNSNYMTLTREMESREIHLCVSH